MNLDTVDKNRQERTLQGQYVIQCHAYSKQHMFSATHTFHSLCHVVQSSNSAKQPIIHVKRGKFGI